MIGVVLCKGEKMAAISAKFAAKGKARRQKSQHERLFFQGSSPGLCAALRRPHVFSNACCRMVYMVARVPLVPSIQRAIKGRTEARHGNQGWRSNLAVHSSGFGGKAARF